MELHGIYTGIVEFASRNFMRNHGLRAFSAEEDVLTELLKNTEVEINVFCHIVLARDRAIVASMCTDDSLLLVVIEKRRKYLRSCPYIARTEHEAMEKQLLRSCCGHVETVSNKTAVFGTVTKACDRTEPFRGVVALAKANLLSGASCEIMVGYILS